MCQKWRMAEGSTDLPAYSDEAGHLFRQEAGQRSDLKPAIWDGCAGRSI